MDIYSEPTFYPMYDMGENELLREEEEAMNEEMVNNLKQPINMKVTHGKNLNSPDFNSSILQDALKHAPIDHSIDMGIDIRKTEAKTLGSQV